MEQGLGRPWRKLKEIITKIGSQRIDILLDRFYYEHLYELAKETDIPLFIKYVKDSIDFTNIRTLIRVKKQGYEILRRSLASNGI